MSEEIFPSNNRSRATFSLDYRVIIFVLLAVIIALLVLWKPWNRQSANSNERTISVSGQATIKAEPDEYLFTPTYQFKNNDKSVALAELTKKSDGLISKIKSLGLADRNIKTGSSGYNNDYQYYYDSTTRTNTYTLQLTITATSRDQAQKLQEYLVTTEPTGAISPQVTFSETMRKQLEIKARDQATKEARAKADQSAKNLGFKVGAVKSVEDGTGFGGHEVYGKTGVSTSIALDNAAAPQLGVQPGQNDLAYSVSVVYYLR